MPTSSPYRKISQFEIFKDFSPEKVEQIVSLSEIRALNPGEILISPGEANDTFFLLTEGTLEIVLEKDGAQFSIPIQTGECLGEMSLLMERPTSALVMGLHDSEVLCVPENVFWDHIMTTRQGARNLMSLMAARLQRTNHALIKEAEEQLKYKHLEKELEAAGKIQANIVPDGRHLFPNRPEVDAFALIKQAREVGGDFYDALVLDNDHIYIAIGDVSGKGMPASLFMVRAFTFLRLLVSNNPGFEDVISSLNSLVLRKNESMMFISIFAGVLDLRTGVLRYVNAGHNPPFASLGGKPFGLLDTAHAPPVGITEEVPFPIKELQMKQGDALVLYTDGIPEALNDDDVMYETSTMEKLFNQHVSLSMADLIKALEDDAESFVGDRAQYDDFTAFAIRYLGPDGKAL